MPLSVPLERLEPRYLLVTGGALDVSFGNHGKVLDPDLGLPQVTAMVVQPDGKIITAGPVQGWNLPYSVARFNPDGSLDLTFGEGTGRVLTGVEARVILIQPGDGKILLIGPSAGPIKEITAERLRPDGLLDVGFDLRGFANFNLAAGSPPIAAALQSDGKIIVGATTKPLPGQDGQDFNLERFNPIGTLDSSFNNGAAEQRFHVPGQRFTLAGLVVTPDDHIIVAGDQGPTNTDFVTHFLVDRFTPNGQFDAALPAPDVQPAPGFNRLLGISTGQDGDIIAVGVAQHSIDQGAVIFRYLPGGAGPDTNFGSAQGTPGRVFYDPQPGVTQPSIDHALGLADGKTVAAVHDGSASLVRFNADGSLDSTFGKGGVAPSSITPGVGVGTLNITPEGRYLIGAGEPFAPDPAHPILELQRFVDEGPPNGPYALTADVVSPTSVHLHFFDNSTDESNFILTRQTPGQAPVSILLLKSAGTGPIDFTDSGLTAGATYTYSVQAFTGSVGSSIAGPVSITLPGGNSGAGTGTAPNTPFALTPLATSPTSVELFFFDNSSDETSFHIVRRRIADGVTTPFTLAAVPGTGFRQFTDTGLDPSTAYDYTVQAFNGAISSGLAGPAQVTTRPAGSPTLDYGGVGTGTAPNGAYALAAAATSPTSVSLTFHDNATNETGFELSRATSPAGPFTPIAILPPVAGIGVGTFIDNTAFAGTTYYYQLKSFNGPLFGSAALSNGATTPAA
jgi:uncharacterized delta-60 repeat protein